MNHFRENQNLFWQKITSTRKYSDTVQNDKKMFILGTNMVKGIKMKEVNSQLRNSFAKLISFYGATLNI